MATWRRRRRRGGGGGRGGGRGALARRGEAPEAGTCAGLVCAPTTELWRTAGQRCCECTASVDTAECSQMRARLECSAEYASMSRSSRERRRRRGLPSARRAAEQAWEEGVQGREEEGRRRLQRRRHHRPVLARQRGDDGADAAHAVAAVRCGEASGEQLGALLVRSAPAVSTQHFSVGGWRSSADSAGSAAIPRLNLG